MTKGKDWIPQAKELFRKFADNFCKLVSANQVAWKLVTTQVTALLDLQTKYNACDDISSDEKNRTKLDVENTAKAFPPFLKAIRVLGIQELKFNVNMTDTDRTNCGVTNNSTSKTPAATANVGPGISTTALGDLNIRVVILEPTTGPMPTGQKEIVIKFGFYAVGAPQPTEAQCQMIYLQSKKKGVVTFDMTNRGLQFIGFARYVNTRNVVGTAATTFKGVVN